MCHDAIFPFYGALSTMPPNIWQYYTALHEHHYAAQNPHFHSPFKAIGSALAARPRRRAREAFIALGHSRCSPADRFDFFSAAALFFLSFFGLLPKGAPGFCQHKNGTVRTNAKTRT